MKRRSHVLWTTLPSTYTAPSIPVPLPTPSQANHSSNPPSPASHLAAQAATASTAVAGSSSTSLTSASAEPATPTNAPQSQPTSTPSTPHAAALTTSSSSSVSGGLTGLLSNKRITPETATLKKQLSSISLDSEASEVDAPPLTHPPPAPCFNLHPAMSPSSVSMGSVLMARGTITLTVTDW